MLYVSKDYGKNWIPVKEGTWMDLQWLTTAYDKAGYSTKYLRGDETNE